MTVLDRLLGRHPEPDDRHQAQGAPSPSPAAECAHGAMTPRWDAIEDMGHEDRASSFVCEACHSTLTPAEAERARAETVARLHLGQ